MRASLPLVMQDLPENPAPQNQILKTALLSSTPQLLNKPGYKTTEFYLALLIALAHIGGVATGKLPGAAAASNVTYVTLAYMGLAFLRKYLAAKNPQALAQLQEIGAATIKVAAQQLAENQTAAK